MPYTANFSERFYEKLGHDVVKELIDLVNHMDLAYRTELSDQNEANFQKFEAVLRGETSSLEAVLRGEMSALAAVLRGDMSALETRLEKKIDGVETRLEGKMEVGFASLRSEIAAGQANMLKWMVFLFLGAVLAVVAVG